VRMNLKNTIALRGWSQIDFAEEVGIHPIRLNRIGNARIEPTPAEREKIAEVLNVDAAWLFRVVTIPNAPALTTPEATLAELSAQIDSANKRIEKL
jgi:transcriptional regulator with XRE-family HTH domain